MHSSIYLSKTVPTYTTRTVCTHLLVLPGNVYRITNDKVDVDDRDRAAGSEIDEDKSWSAVMPSWSPSQFGDFSEVISNPPTERIVPGHLI